MQGHPLLKEMLFKEEPRSVSNSNDSSPCLSSSSSPGPSEYESSSALRELLFKGVRKEAMDAIHKTIQPKVEPSQEELVNPLQKEEELFKDGQKSDHQLLREVLRDTSFQRKYNLRPVDLGGVGTGYVEDMEAGECVGDLAREQLEPVLSLAIQQLQKDFDNTCVALGIHPGRRSTLLPVVLSRLARAAKVRSAIFQVGLRSTPPSTLLLLRFYARRITHITHVAYVRPIAGTFSSARNVSAPRDSPRPSAFILRNAPFFIIVTVTMDGNQPCRIIIIIIRRIAHRLARDF